ncbi:MAG: hypothetical protein M3209_13400 [Acidobacteriota bacterium]|nr:hypothetical protein [Acidobacteriota bacterium]
MSKEYESADLILKLYEMRREPVMREARAWMIGFFPESAQGIIQAMINPQTSAYYRMVTTYWDMAASFVLNGAIDEQMFTDANAEHIVVFSKIEPFLAELRTTLQNPNMLKNLELLVMRMPNAKETLAARREMMKRWMKAREEMAKAPPQS